MTGPLTEKLKKSYSRISDSDDCFKKYSILGYFLYREIQFCTFGEPNGPCNVSFVSLVYFLCKKSISFL